MISMSSGGSICVRRPPAARSFTAGAAYLGTGGSHSSAAFSSSIIDCLDPQSSANASEMVPRAANEQCVCTYYNAFAPCVCDFKSVWALQHC